MSVHADNGYISPADKPSSPVEWTVFDGGGKKPVPSFTVYDSSSGSYKGEILLFEADISGFDSFGYAVLARGFSTNDTMQIYFRHPMGGDFSSQYASFYSGGEFSATNGNTAIPVTSARLQIAVEVSNYSTPTSAGDIVVQIFARRTSRSE